MKFPSKERLVELRNEYPVGCRVELISMDDPQAPPKGARGTVRAVSYTHLTLPTSDLV